MYADEEQLVIKYRDEDGDEIVISSEEELKEAFKVKYISVNLEWDIRSYGVYCNVQSGEVQSCGVYGNVQSTKVQSDKEYTQSSRHTARN